MSSEETSDSGNTSSILGVNLGELSRPATVLVEKISDAIGGIAKPWQIIRVAKAEAVAKRIEAESQIEVSELQRRALRRFLHEEERKQRNIEAITENALPQLKDGANPAGIDDDWIANFFDKCRLVSDSEVQSLWARVLAGEANSPGSYSKRTIGILASLDKEEAELFTCFGSLLWQGSNNEYFVIESDAIGSFWRFRLHFRAAEHHLQNIGLVDANTLNYPVSALAGRDFRYFDECFRFKLPAQYSKPLIELFLPATHLTAVGTELMRIAGAKPLVGYAEAVMQDEAKLLRIDFERLK